MAKVASPAPRGDARRRATRHGEDDVGLGLVVEFAHDLRSPLSSILVLSDVIQRGDSGPVSEKQRQQLALVYGAALQLGNEVSDLLELVRSGDRLGDSELVPFSIADVLAAVRDMTLPIAEEKGLEIHLRVPVTRQRVGHQRALSRVLLNLVTNALKVTERGFVEIAAVTKYANRVEFSVRDTGPGIEHAALKTLCQPFQRDQGHHYHFSGPGLGLAICRRLLNAMKAELNVDTVPGQGTRFFFELELAPVSGHAGVALAGVSERG